MRVRSTFAIGTTDRCRPCGRSWYIRSRGVSAAIRLVAGVVAGPRSAVAPPGGTCAGPARPRTRPVAQPEPGCETGCTRFATWPHMGPHCIGTWRHRIGILTQPRGASADHLAYALGRPSHTPRGAVRGIYADGGGTSLTRGHPRGLSSARARATAPGPARGCLPVERKSWSSLQRGRRDSLDARMDVARPVRERARARRSSLTGRLCMPVIEVEPGDDGLEGNSSFGAEPEDRAAPGARCAAPGQELWGGGARREVRISWSR